MQIIAVDDERPALTMLLETVKGVVADAGIFGFTSPSEAVSHVREHPTDVAFLDMQMCGMNGLELAHRLKAIRPRINIIFVTAHAGYMEHAFSMHASGYLLKPVTAEQIAMELEDLRYPVPRRNGGIRVQTFGNFEVFVDDQPVYFARSKSKEILAYLIDRRGAGVTKKELAAVLWDDDSYTRSRQNYLHNLLAEMMEALEKAGAAQIVVKKRNLYAVRPSRLDCDYYNYLKWDVRAINSFHGEYMTNYSWAEFTLGGLDSKEL